MDLNLMKLKEFIVQYWWCYYVTDNITLQKMFPPDLVIFTDEMFNGKLHFLCIVLSFINDILEITLSLIAFHVAVSFAMFLIKWLLMHACNGIIIPQWYCCLMFIATIFVLVKAFICNQYVVSRNICYCDSLQGHYDYYEIQLFFWEI